MTNTYTKITSVEQLKSFCTDETSDFFIWLGGARSSKDIYFDSESEKFLITNCIDDSEQDLTEEELMDDSYTNIGTAITNGTFYKY